MYTDIVARRWLSRDNSFLDMLNISRRENVKIVIAPTYDDSRAKIALWNDPQVQLTVMTNGLFATSSDFKIFFASQGEVSIWQPLPLSQRTHTAIVVTSPSAIFVFLIGSFIS